MKHHLQRAEQQDSSSNVTKYCTCHAKWLSWVMSVTYETSFTMRGATGVIHQRHQVLCLPRKMTLMSDVRHIWNVIYIARSNRHHPPTSPNTAPATQNYTPKSKKNLPKTVEASFPMRGRFDHDPTMKLQNWTRPFAELTFPPSATHFVLKITTFRASAIYPDFTEYCTCHEKWHSKITKYCACHEKWLSWLILVTYETSFTLRGATGLPLQRHQVLCLPRKMTLMSDVRQIWNVIYNALSNRTHPPTSPNTAALLLYWTVTLLSCYFTELNFTELLLYWAVTLLNCYFTELLLYWTVTWLNCYLLSCYFTELLLYWAVTLLNCYWAVPFWAGTWLSCYFTELLLYWAVTLLVSLHF